jgi:hypothetical protein
MRCGTCSRCRVEAQDGPPGLLCRAALDLPGVECCRGYIQNWWGPGDPIPERLAQRILKAADQILSAGTEDADASPVNR